MAMKKGSTLFLKSVLLLIGFGVFACMLWFPHIEGRAANLDLLNIYADPFIIYLYIVSIPFFVGLYQAFRLLNFIEKNQTFTDSAVKTLRNMKLCGIAFSTLFLAGMPYIFQLAQQDDAPGIAAIGFAFIFASGVVATAAGVFQKLLQNAVDLKAENDLTV